MKPLPALLAAISLVVMACGSTGRLAEYDFQDRTVAAAYDIPPHPQVFTGPFFVVDPERPLHTVLAAGSQLAKELQVTGLRAKLDSAGMVVDVADRLASRTLDRATRYLRAQQTGDAYEADFVLEVNVREYGINAEHWDAAAYFFVDAEVFLIDAFDGSQIWHERVRERDRITHLIFGDVITRDIVTATAFASLTVDEIAHALDRLVDYCADHITRHLRGDLDKSRRAPPS